MTGLDCMVFCSICVIGLEDVFSSCVIGLDSVCSSCVIGLGWMAYPPVVSGFFFFFFFGGVVAFLLRRQCETSRICNFSDARALPSHLLSPPHGADLREKPATICL